MIFVMLNASKLNPILVNDGEGLVVSSKPKRKTKDKTQAEATNVMSWATTRWSVRRTRIDGESLTLQMWQKGTTMGIESST